MKKEGRVLAGSQPLKSFLYDPRTDHIRKRHGTDKSHAPPKAFLPIIEEHENQHKSVKRHPEHGIPEIRQNLIKNGVGPLAVELYK